MRISDWSSDVCSSDLRPFMIAGQPGGPAGNAFLPVHESDGARRGGGELLLDQREMRAGEDDRIDAVALRLGEEASQYIRKGARIEIGRASWRERVCQYV